MTMTGSWVRGATDVYPLHHYRAAWRQHPNLAESEEKEKEALQLQIRKEKELNLRVTGRWALEAADVCPLHRNRAA